MPDWVYRTVSRPLLFRLPASTGRDLALGLMGWLVRGPGGANVIDLVGPIRVGRHLEHDFLGMRLATPVGIGPHLDRRAVALSALERFGVGFMEVGPVALHASGVSPTVCREFDRQAIRGSPWAVAVDELEPRLARSA